MNVPSLNLVEKFVTAADGLHHRCARTRVWESDCTKSVTDGMLIVCTRDMRLDRNSIHTLILMVMANVAWFPLHVS